MSNSSPTLDRRLSAEFIGTFAIVFGGTTAAASGVLPHLGVAMTFGLSVGLMVFALGHISGAHFNPAVTIGLASAGKASKKDIPAYIIAQLAGATVASLVLKVAIPYASLGGTNIAPAYGIGAGFIYEFVCTAFLVLVISAVATDKRAPQGAAPGLAIGGTIVWCAFFAGPISGGSFNPARSFGPALVAGSWANHWLYWAAPILGGVTGAQAYKLLRQGGGE